MNAGRTLTLTLLASLCTGLSTATETNGLSSAASLESRESFDRFSRKDDTPGEAGIREVKFIIVDVQSPPGTLHLIDTSQYEYHVDFATNELYTTLNHYDFNQLTYFTQNRKILAGAILAYDDAHAPDGKKGVYALKFWPSDPISCHFVNIAYKHLTQALPFASSNLYYHPSGETQLQLLETELSFYEKAHIPIITTAQLFGNRQYTPLNLGTGYGRLRIMDGSSSRPPSATDIVIFKNLPNTLSHVAGVLTDLPQTPLSHINLKAKQNNTPNAFLAEASSNPELRALDGKTVRLDVKEKGYTIREASQAEVRQFLEQSRPQTPITPPRDLTETHIRPLSNIRHTDLSTVGAKAANMGELLALLKNDRVIPDGFAVPFSFYHEFMIHNRLYTVARKMMARPEFQNDPSIRSLQLKAFRKQIRHAVVPESLADKLMEMTLNVPRRTPLRCRSSTNTEDLEGFNGAGLYDSYTHRPKEGHIGNTLKQVWASLWNYRAFEERDYYRIDHFATAMGVLVHPNFDDEKANGVALTKNPYDSGWGGAYINVQVGEDLVTNPEKGELPDEILIMQTTTAEDPLGQSYETIYIRQSTRVAAGKHVLTQRQIEHLTRVLNKIKSHFAALYGVDENDLEAYNAFAMDVEFKIDRSKQLVIKQARPWVD